MIVPNYSKDSVPEFDKEPTIPAAIPAANRALAEVRDTDPLP
jgi:hypothetical protein